MMHTIFNFLKSPLFWIIWSLVFGTMAAVELVATGGVVFFVCLVVHVLCLGVQSTRASAEGLL